VFCMKSKWQGCQISLGIAYQNKPIDYKIYQMTINIPEFSLPMHSKIYPNWDFWYENIPSGNPGKWVENVQVFFRLSVDANCLEPPSSNFFIIFIFFYSLMYVLG
jgi:hypothetical protein